MSERCTWCGAERVPPGTGAFDYECQTGYFARSHTCYDRQIAALEKERDEARADSARMDWLERNLLNLSHGRATNSVDMSGKDVRGQLVNEARGSGGGPSYFRVCHVTIRQAIDDAMNWKKELK